MADATDYQGLGIRLLPLGRIWRLTRDLKSELANILLALGAEFARVDGKFVQVTVEMDPRQAHDSAETADGGLLRDWEALYAITATGTPSDRRTVLAARVTAIGGGSRPQYLIDQAAACTAAGNPTVTIQELRSFRCKDNCHSIRSTLTGGGTVDPDTAQPIGLGHKWSWCFVVHAPAAMTSDQRTALQAALVPLVHIRSVAIYAYDS